MEISRRTWIAAVKLAVVISVLAAIVAILASTLGNVPQVAIVIPLVVVAFLASWVQTGRIHRSQLPAKIVVSSR